MKNYGIPYMGSKTKILPLIHYLFEREYKCKYFIDMFCGGLAVSHYALENSKFKVLANDYNKYVISLYEEILFNKSKNIKKVWFNWVSRDTFMKVKENPEKFEKWYVGYVLTIWSFGNRQATYMFGKHIEKEKEALHNALVFNNWKQLKTIDNLKDFDVTESIKNMDYKKQKNKRLLFMTSFKNFIKEKRTPELEQLEQLERIQQLERSERLERLERLEQLQLFSDDWYDFYKNIPDEILKNAFIYCDPPYENTGKYQVGKNFDYLKFWEWVRDCPYSVYVSSYKAPEDIQKINFVLKTVLLSSNKGKRNVKKENIYWNGKGNYEKTLYDMLFN